MAGDKLEVKKVSPISFEVFSRVEGKIYLISKCGSDWQCGCPDHIFNKIDCVHIKEVKRWINSLYESSSQNIKSLISPEQFYTLTARFDKLEAKIEVLINKIIDEANNGNHQKEISLTNFFTRFCTLKAIDESHPTARSCKTAFARARARGMVAGVNRRGIHVRVLA